MRKVDDDDDDDDEWYLTITAVRVLCVCLSVLPFLYSPSYRCCVSLCALRHLGAKPNAWYTYIYIFELYIEYHYSMVYKWVTSAIPDMWIRTLVVVTICGAHYRVWGRVESKPALVRTLQKNPPQVFKNHLRVRWWQGFWFFSHIDIVIALVDTYCFYYYLNAQFVFFFAKYNIAR